MVVFLIPCILGIYNRILVDKEENNQIVVVDKNLKGIEKTAIIVKSIVKNNLEGIIS